MSHKTILTQQQQYYGDQFDEFGDDIRSTFQNNEVTQFHRFDRLIDPFLALYGKAEFSIHDLGSGLADLHRYLNMRGLKHEYSGTEIVEDMAELSRKKFPEIPISSTPFDKAASNQSYDLVVASGTFNLKGGQDSAEWSEYVYDVIRHMFRACRVAISFNFLTSHSTFTEDTLFYANPAEIFTFCATELSRFVHLDHGYPLYEFTITVFKDQAIASRYTDPELAKYHRQSHL